ncbi:MAG: hypothetical protein ACE15C_04655 [Phycisphaerae bacterium]
MLKTSSVHWPMALRSVLAAVCAVVGAQALNAADADAPGTPAGAPAASQQAQSRPTGVLSVSASNDGVPLKYGLFVPKAAAGGGGGAQKLPMIVDVTPTETLDLDVGSLGYLGAGGADFIVLRLPPFGRGGLQWSPFAERDTLQVIRLVMAEHPVDPDRVYLLGATQGFSGNGYGTRKLQFGTISLAYHCPDLFAAVATGAGDVRADAYRPTWLGDWHQYQLQYELPSRLRETPILWAENLVNTPTWLVMSDVGNLYTVRMQLFHALDKFEPVELKLTQMPELRGEVDPRKAGRSLLNSEFVKEQVGWLLKHKRDMRPRRVVLTTNTLKYRQSRWLRVNCLSEVNRFCRIEAHWTEDGRLKVRGEGFESFTVEGFDKFVGEAKKVTVDIEHQVLDVEPQPTASFWRANSKWGRGVLSQGKGLGGSDTVIDAMCEPYVLVPGTGGGEDAAKKLKALAADTINAIQNGGMTTPIDLSAVPVKADTAITAEDMKRYNLVLFGDEKTNSIIAKINDKLPIRLDGGKIISGQRTFSYPDQGLIMVYPSPLAPGRKVVIVTGAIFKGYLLTDKKLAGAAFPANLPAHGFPMLGDWLIFRENGKAVAKMDRELKGLDNAIVEGGYFDGDWKWTDQGPFYFFNKNFAR